MGVDSIITTSKRMTNSSSSSSSSDSPSALPPLKSAMNRTSTSQTNCSSSASTFSSSSTSTQSNGSHSHTSSSASSSSSTSTSSGYNPSSLSTSLPQRKKSQHVSSACNHCKQCHLACDNQRPCTRCIRTGREHLCQDVVHKKRGRPRLNPRATEVIAESAAASVDPGRSYLTDPRFQLSQRVELARFATTRALMEDAIQCTLPSSISSHQEPSFGGGAAAAASSSSTNTPAHSSSSTPLSATTTLAVQFPLEVGLQELDIQRVSQEFQQVFGPLPLWQPLTHARTTLYHLVHELDQPKLYALHQRAVKKFYTSSASAVEEISTNKMFPTNEMTDPFSTSQEEWCAEALHLKMMNGTFDLWTVGLLLHRLPSVAQQQQQRTTVICVVEKYKHALYDLNWSAYIHSQQHQPQPQQTMKPSYPMDQDPIAPQRSFTENTSMLRLAPIRFVMDGGVCPPQSLLGVSEALGLVQRSASVSQTSTSGSAPSLIPLEDGQQDSVMDDT